MRTPQDRSREHRHCAHATALPLQQLRMRRCQAGDGHTRGGAGDVVEADVVAEADRGGMAAVFAADADFEFGARLAAQIHGEFHEFADALDVEDFERVVLQDAGGDVMRQELVLGVFAAE